ARLGQAAEVARAWIAEAAPDPDGSTRLVYRWTWGAPGIEPAPGAMGQEGMSVREAGLLRLEEDLRAGKAVVTVVSDLPPAERSFPAQVGSKSFAAVPIFSNGEWWGLLGFGETRFEREWSAPEVEALRAAAAVLGSAIEREEAE